MTADQRFEQDLPALLTDLVMPAVPSYRDEIVRQIEASPQRPAWTFPERWIPMDTAMRRLPVAPINWRLIALAALLVVAVVAIAIVAAGANRRLPAPPYGLAVNGLIAYAEKGDVYLGDPVTGDTRQITKGPEVDGGVYFSRDGTRLVIFRESPPGSPLPFDMLIANPDGSGLFKLTDSPLVDGHGGDWSGDGRWFVMSSEIEGRATMTLFDLDSRTSRILDMGMPAENPIFRPPDGLEILFWSDDDQMYVVDLHGGTPRRLAQGGGHWYSPDGSRIAYFVQENRPNSGEILKVRLHVMNADGTNDQLLADKPDIWYQNPRGWSPDGLRVLVIRGYHDGRRVLAVVPADRSGTGVEYAVPIAIDDDWGNTGWSPDGRFIYFASEKATEATLIDTLDRSMRPMPLWYAADLDGDASSQQRLAP